MVCAGWRGGSKVQHLRIQPEDTEGYGTLEPDTASGAGGGGEPVAGAEGDGAPLDDGQRNPGARGAGGLPDEPNRGRGARSGRTRGDFAGSSRRTGRCRPSSVTRQSASSSCCATGRVTRADTPRLGRWSRRSARGNREVLVPGAHLPGETQAAFGRALVRAAGRPRKVALFGGKCSVLGRRWVSMDVWNPTAPSPWPCNWRGRAGG